MAQWHLRIFVALAALASVASPVRMTQLAAQQHRSNPVHKVLTMLRDLEKKLMEKGGEQERMHKDFVGYCDTKSKELNKNIAESENRIPGLTNDIKGAQKRVGEADSDLGEAKTERSSLAEEIQGLMNTRTQDATTFEKRQKEYNEILALIKQAIGAYSAGSAGAFLQTHSAVALRKLLVAKASTLEIDTSDLLETLSGKRRPGYYSPQGGVVLGVLETLKSRFQSDMEEHTDSEKKAKVYYKELVAAKTAEAEISTKKLESKQPVAAQLGLDIVNMQHDLDDAKEALDEDKKYLADLENDCANKASEWEAGSSWRDAELMAIREVIKLLEKDDVVDAFEPISSGSAASFFQVSRPHRAKARAHKIIRKASKGDPRLNFISFALQGKKKGFQLVVKQIDGMIDLLKQEQTGDDAKIDYCHRELADEERKVKDFSRSLAETKSKAGRSHEGFSALDVDIEGLGAHIQENDKSVKDATEQRKAEADANAAELKLAHTAQAMLGSAVERLKKFYTSQQLQLAKESEVPDGEQVVVSFDDDLDFVQTAMVSKHRHTKHRHTKHRPTTQRHHRHSNAPDSEESLDDQTLPPSAPEYRKSTEGFQAIQMLQNLIKDFRKKVSEVEMNEKEAQKDYEALTEDAAEKRKSDVKQQVQKTVEKANLALVGTSAKGEATGLAGQLKATQDALDSMHESCDWLVRHYGERQQARANELSQLDYAKDVLGAARFG